MLKKLILENWKSFRYAELPLDPLTVLIGTNASGKSNVVEALEFLQRIANGENIETALAGDKTLPSIRGGVEWAGYQGKSVFTLKTLIQGDNNKIDYLHSIEVCTDNPVHLLEENITVYDYQDNNRILYQTFSLDGYNFVVRSYLSNYQSCTIGQFFNLRIDGLNEENEKSHKRTLDFNDKKLPNLINNVIRPTIANILILNPIPSKMRDFSRLSENIESDASNIAGVLAALSEEKKAEVELNLSYYIKDLPEGDIQKLWAEKVGRFGTDAMLYCQEEWKPGETTEIDARNMSDGTLRFLAILTALLTRPEGSQIVIEEIDNGLHPSRAALLVKILKEIGSKRNIDILLTTHNPALLDAFGSEIVPFVVVAHRDSETGESKLTLLEDIDNFPKLFASYSLGQMTTKGAIERSLSHGE
ncbi:AAA family ATPase [Anabaena sp. WFMT]|uniref:AAA family ATPase n=1 Tax=Anabaena sp. WFMT TaxID=3449730 RepID=UPI003F2880ED